VKRRVRSREALPDPGYVPRQELRRSRRNGLRHGQLGGIGHTSGLYTDQDRNADRIKYFGDKMKTARILINTPTTQGGIGDLYNFALAPS
jgi:hypothetical protein